MFEQYMSSRMALLETESAFKILARAKALEAQGRSIIHMEIGQPDFPTPRNIIEAAYRAMNEGHTGYTPTPGYPETRKAIAVYAEKYKKINTSADEVVVVPGAKPIIYFTMQMLVENGDEVICPNPSFPIYESCIKYSGGVPVPLPLKLDNDFRPDLYEFKKSLTNKTKLVILNNPSNPTGGVFTRGDIRGMADILKKYPDVFVLSDEIYDRIVYDDSNDGSDGGGDSSGGGDSGNGSGDDGNGGGNSDNGNGSGDDGNGGGNSYGGSNNGGDNSGASGGVASIATIPWMKDRTIILDGLSKTYSMTGWRLGYGIMHPELARQMELLMVNSFSCAPAFTQIAAIEALGGPQESVAEMLNAFRERRDYLVAGLNAIKGIRCPLPKGAFYVFPDISGFGISSDEFADRLLTEGGVAASSGASFGKYGEGCIRLSYATSLENIKTATERIAAFVKTIHA